MFAVSTFGFGQTTKVETDIQNIMKKLDVVGISVAVVKHNNIIYTHSFEKKNIEKTRR